jgi:hypothetical protein
LHNLLDKQSRGGLISSRLVEHAMATPMATRLQQSAQIARRSQRFDEIIQNRRRLPAKSGALTGR